MHKSRTGLLLVKRSKSRLTRDRLFAPTIKTTGSDVSCVSHEILLRGGYVRPLSSGSYTYLPLSLRIMNKLQAIIHEELEEIDCIQMDMPSLQSKLLWDLSNRWSKSGEEMLKFKDRHGKQFCLAPTCEEAVTMIAKETIQSYRQLPFRPYQITRKFRDEQRPRAGLLRAREFLMKDLYTFDEDKDKALKTFNSVKKTYDRIFSRFGVNFVSVEAESGNMGGSLSREYHIICENGEDSLAVCNSCDYRANIEKAKSNINVKNDNDINDMYMVKFTNNNNKDNNYIYIKAVVPKGHLVNPIFIRDTLISHDLISASNTGDIDIIDFNDGDKYAYTILDKSIAFDNGNHLHNIFVDNIHVAKHNDSCINCSAGQLKIQKAIEVGHIFHLDTAYSLPMKALFQSRNGKYIPYNMGCYGIGVSRLISSVIETNSYYNKENNNFSQAGVVFPWNIAPYKVCILTGNKKLKIDSTYLPLIDQKGKHLYDKLNNTTEYNDEVLLDDRDDVSLSFKLKDASLMGFPIVVIIGQSIKDDQIEVVVRKLENNDNNHNILTERKELLSIDEAINRLMDEYHIHIKEETEKLTNYE